MMNQMEDERSSSGPRKRRFDGPDRGLAKRSAGIPETLFRLVVPGKRVGSLIGKGGSIIKQMREETGARITVADAPLSSEERMVVIQAQEVVQNVQFGPAQLALFRVHNRLLEAIAQEAEKTGIVPDGGRVTTRLLIADTQAGSVIGRKGDIIKQIRETSKAFIKVLPQEENPAMATPEDRVVQIVGEPAQVQLALEIVSKQLRENPPKGHGAADHPLSSAPPQQIFPARQPFLPSSTPLSFGTAYQIESTTGALVPVPMSRGPAAAAPPIRFEEPRRIVFAQDQFNHAQDQFNHSRGEPNNLGPVYDNRGEALLMRRDLGSGGAEGSFPLDERVMNRTVDYSRVAVNRPPGDFEQLGVQQLRGPDAGFERRATPPWSRGTNPDAAGGLGIGVLGAGGLPAGVPSAGVLGGEGFGGGPSIAGPSIASTVKMTVKMTIARSMLGAVIGRKGANVQQIRQVSGAMVKVLDKEEQPVVEIEGSMEAVTAAQILIQQSVMQADQDRTNGNRMPPQFNAPALGGQFGGPSFQSQGGGARAPGLGGPQRR